MINTFVSSCCHSDISRTPLVARPFGLYFRTSSALLTILVKTRKSAFLSPTSQSVSSAREGLITLQVFSLCSVYYTKVSTSSLSATEFRTLHSPVCPRFYFVTAFAVKHATFN